MDREAYRLMAELEERHWWYRGRRTVIRRLLERLELPAESALLEVGCGTGGNLGLLGDFGSAVGLEPAPDAEALGRWQGEVVRGRARHLPFADGSVDVVAALDVLEHLHDELVALDEMRRVLRPGGYVVLYVPAYQLLWGHEDILSHHLRRYRRGQLRRLLTAARLEIVHLGYVTTLLFPAIAAAKIGKRLLHRGGPPRSDVASLPPAMVNDALTVVAEAEAEVAARLELPFGASIVGAARKPLVQQRRSSARVIQA